MSSLADRLRAAVLSGAERRARAQIAREPWRMHDTSMATCMLLADANDWRLLQQWSRNLDQLVRG